MSHAFSARSARSIWLLSMCTALLGGAAGAGAMLLVRGGGGADADGPVATLSAEGGSAPGNEALVRAAEVADEPGEPDTRVAGEVSGERDAPDTVTLDTFTAALDEAAAERSQLAATLVGLNRDVAALEQAIGAFNLPTGDAAGGAVAGTAVDGPATGVPGAGVQAGGGRGGRNGLDRDGLLAAGVDPLVAAELERRNDAWQLARLDLVDRAAREGWEDSDELDDQLEQLDGERPDLREELGDEGYDAYLYGAGRSNRVVVVSVIPGSAAESSGLREGDTLMSYAGERLFDIRALQRGTRAGSLGESVTVQVVRDGQTVQVSIPRGPLGVSLGPESVEP